MAETYFFEGKMTEITENGAPLTNADTILCSALDIGEHILKNGGEIHRVEDTIERICRSFGAEHVEVFTITSLIVASIRMPDGTYSHQMRRIYKITNNLYMVEAMNGISRRLCAGEIPISDLRSKIVEAKNKKPYHEIVLYLGAMMAAGGFAVFFGGSVLDGVCAALIGVLMTSIDMHLPRFINRMVSTVVLSIIAGVLGILICKLGVGQSADKVMIGTIMLLIPGLSLGNSIRDLLGGDTISGALRLIESLLLALMIAFGFAVAMLVTGGAAV